MLKWINKIFPHLKVKELEAENQELKEKLVERQETINKTNAYWKKKLYQSKSKPKES